MSTQYDSAEQWEFSAGRHWSQQPDCDVAHPAREEPNSGCNDDCPSCLAGFDEWERQQAAQPQEDT